MKKNNTPKLIVVCVAIMGLLFISLPSTTFTGGAPASYTNAPTTGTNREANCTSCHAGTLQTSGTNFNNIAFTGTFTGGGYIPDSTYTLTLSYTHTGKSKFGYQLTCLDNNNAMAGSFATISGNTKSSIISGTVASGTRQYMRQTSSGSAGSGSASWSFEWTAPSSNVGDVTIYSVVNSANSAGGNSGDIIIAKEFNISPSTLLPEATASTTNATICQGALISLTGASTNSATSWNWSTPSGSPSSSTSQNPTIRYNFPGTFNAILTSTNAKGQSLPDTLRVTVLPAPGPFIQGGATQQFCEGDSILLACNVESGATYTWNTGATGPQLWVTTAGDYFVTATGTNSCGRVSNTVTTTNYPKPTVTLTSNATPFVDSTCTNSMLELSAGSVAFDSFFFYGDGVLLAASDTATLSTFFDKKTTYGLQVMNTQGCLSDTAILIMNAKEQSEAPTVSCTASTPSSITFEWSSISAHLGYEISTNGGTNWGSPSSGASGTTHVVTGLQPEDSVILWIRSLEPAPCNYSKIGITKCFSQACVQLDATVQAPPAVCWGDSWTIEVNGLSGENYSLSLDGGAAFTDTVFSFAPLVSKSYTLSVLDSNNLVCPAKEISIPVVVDRIQDVDLKAGKLGAYCAGEAITFTANETSETFQFYLNNVLIQSGTTNSYTSNDFSDLDSLYVIVTDGECIDTSATVYVNIEVEPNSGFTFTRSGSEYTFSPDVSTYAAYRWNFGDGSTINNDVSPTHDYKASSGQEINASLEVETINSCQEDSTQTIQLPEFAGVSELNAIGISIYPNPTTDKLNIENTSGKPFEYKLYNTAGTLISTAKIVGTNGTVDLSDLPAGAYILKGAIDASNETSIRVIKK